MLDPVPLTRLEFNLTKDYETPQSWENIVARVAPILEHLTIRGVRQVLPESVKNEGTLILPLLPKLRVLRFYISQNDVEPGRICKLRVFELILKFVTANPGQTLNYPTQFPSLLRLVVDKMKTESPSLSEGSWFERCLPFLDSFLPQQGPCQTLRLLDVPIPIRIETHWKMDKVCSCSECSPSWTRSRSIAKERMRNGFFARVAATFPNAMNLGRYRELAVKREGKGYDVL